MYITEVGMGVYIELSDEQVAVLLIASHKHLTKIEEELYRLKTICKNPERVRYLYEQRNLMTMAIQALWRGRVYEEPDVETGCRM